jgi:hypothetical protein
MYIPTRPRPRLIYIFPKQKHQLEASKALGERGQNISLYIEGKTPPSARQ